MLLPCRNLGSKPDDDNLDEKDDGNHDEKDDDDIDDRHESDSLEKDLHDKNMIIIYQSIDK